MESVVRVLSACDPLSHTVCPAMIDLAGSCDYARAALVATFLWSYRSNSGSTEKENFYDETRWLPRGSPDASCGQFRVGAAHRYLSPVPRVQECRPSRLDPGSQTLCFANGNRGSLLRFLELRACGGFCRWYGLSAALAI